MMRALFLFGIGLALVAFPQEMPKGYFFPVGTYDRWGYLQWTDGGPINPKCEAALSEMRKGNFSGAWRILKQYRKGAPKDLTAIQGLVECALWTNKLPALLEEIATEAGSAMKGGGAPPAYLSLAFQYAYAVLTEEQNQGRRIDFNLGASGTAAGYYGGRLFNDERALDEEDKISCAMFVSAKLAGGDYMGARAVAARLLRKRPSFYQMRLMYAQCLRRGILAKSDPGNPGKWIPASEDEKPQPKRAYEEAMTVIREKPEFIEAYYVAGAAAISFDKASAKKHLSYYVSKSKNSMRREAASKALMSLAER